MVEAKLLSEIPLSGSIDELRFNATGNCTWVEFTDDSYNSWCGIFGHGVETGHSSVAVNVASQSFVISQGQGYLIDINARRLLHLTENDWLISVVSIPESDIFIACTSTEIYAYASTGLLWESERISFDGIELNFSDNQEIKGKVWNLEGWFDFSLKLKGWVYQSEFKCDC